MKSKIINNISKIYFFNFILFKYKKYKYFNKRKNLLKSLPFGSKSNQYYLISYPRSGNTWMRMLLANLLADGGEEISLLNVGTYVPDTHLKLQVEFMKNINSKFYSLPIQICKTHDPYCSFYKDKKIIYIIRDGRDVLTSYYHYLNSRREKSVSLSKLIKDKSDPMGSWSSHALGWANAKCSRKLILKYEDLLSNTEKELKKLLDFIGWERSNKQIQLAIERSDFHNLKWLEKKYGGINLVKTKKEKKEPFFRKGKQGDWVSLFTKSDLEMFWRYHGNGMHKFGYY